MWPLMTVSMTVDLCQDLGWEWELTSAFSCIWHVYWEGWVLEPHIPTDGWELFAELSGVSKPPHKVI